MDLSEFVDDIVRDFPEALEPEAKRAVVRAVLTFFRESEAWRQTDTVAMDGSTSECVLTLPSDTVILSVVSADFVDGQETRWKLVAETPSAVKAITSGSPQTFYSGADVLYLSGAPLTGSVDCEVALVPTRAIEAVPDELVDLWYEDIRNGICAYMYAMPGKTWASAGLAKEFNILFSDGILKARRHARGDRNRPRRVVKFNPGY